MKSTVEQEGTRQEPIREQRIECAGWLPFPFLLPPHPGTERATTGDLTFFTFTFYFHNFMIIKYGKKKSHKIYT